MQSSTTLAYDSPRYIRSHVGHRAVWTAQPQAHEYLQRYDLPASSVANAMEALKILDLIEYGEEWHLVDPVMAAWITDVRAYTIQTVTHEPEAKDSP